MQLFVLSQHCKERVHCSTCRNQEDGRAWREAVGRRYSLPNNNIDFTCPYGHDWGYKVAKPKVAKPERCVCSSLDLVNKGCQCGHFKSGRARSFPATPQINKTPLVTQKSSDCGCSRKKKNA